MKKVLFVSPHLPTKLGGTRRLYYNLFYFSKSFEVHFIKLSAGKDTDQLPIGLPKNIRFKEIKCRGASIDPYFFLYPQYLHSTSGLLPAKAQVQQYIDENEIDAVIFYTQPCSVAMRTLRAPLKVGEILDSPAAYYSAKAADMPSAKNILLNSIVPFAWKHLEPELQKHFDLLIYVSEIDVQKSTIAREKIFISFDVRDPPLVQGEKAAARKNDVVLFGRWVHPPNRDGLLSIMPHLGKINGNVLIIGPGIKEGAHFPPNVKVQGIVDDVNAYLLDSKICIVPVWYGAGLQNKVFDALRCGCKVVSTRFTRASFEINGFSSDAITYSGDLLGATNKALAAYSKNDAQDSFAAYEKFQALTIKNEQDYINKVYGLLEAKKGRLPCHSPPKALSTFKHIEKK